MNAWSGRMARATLGTLLIVAFAPMDGPADPGPRSFELLGDFPDGWESQWKLKKFSDDPNRLHVVPDENDNPVLEFDSQSTASGLWHKLKVEPLSAARLSWRWKVDRSLASPFDERRKEGDDYAARVFVAFNKPLLPWRTNAICYVWAGEENVGESYPNPFTGHVKTIVLQSGNDNARRWVLENRDLVADHLAVFGKTPEKVEAFAVMVDTDNTGTRTKAWFDDLVFRVE